MYCMYYRGEPAGSRDTSHIPLLHGRPVQWGTHLWVGKIHAMRVIRGTALSDGIKTSILDSWAQDPPPPLPLHLAIFRWLACAAQWVLNTGKCARTQERKFKVVGRASLNACNFLTLYLMKSIFSHFLNLTSLYNSLLQVYWLHSPLWWHRQLIKRALCTWEYQTGYKARPSFCLCFYV